LSEPNDSSLKIAEHIINFLEEEVSMKRLPQNLLSLQVSRIYCYENNNKTFFIYRNSINIIDI
jgi:hypothetical protein